jgi:phage-related protein
MNAFIINDAVNSRANLGLRITQPPAFPATQRIIEKIDVDGREGSLTLLKGWEDITLTLKAAVLGQNCRTAYRTAVAAILAASTVRFSNDPDVFYKVKYAKIGEMSMLLRTLGEFQVSFICAPFKYIRGVAMVTMTASGSITNPGTVYSLPKIKVYGTGTRNLTINGKLITLNILSGNLTLDSELKECHYGDVAQNQNMSGDFPIFNVGSNTVTLGAGITKVEIEPRWRYL